MNSIDLNEKIMKFCEDFKNDDHKGITVNGLGESGKIVPYIGWFWRPVDFDKPIRLGYIPGQFVGFMENNKWDYDEWKTTKDQTTGIIEHLERFVAEPCNETAQHLFDYVQSCIPLGVKNKWLETTDDFKICRNDNPDPVHDCMYCTATNQCKLFQDWVDLFDSLLRERS